MTLRLVREETLPDEDVRAIAAGLDAYNAGFRPGADWAPRYILARDEAGALGAGLRYSTAMDWLHVQWLWVSEPYRRSGFGSRLIQAAEAEARSLGLCGLFLDTFSFQAPEFYKKLGFREFGRIEDFPRGHARIWLMKPVS